MIPGRHPNPGSPPHSAAEERDRIKKEYRDHEKNADRPSASLRPPVLRLLRDRGKFGGPRNRRIRHLRGRFPRRRDRPARNGDRRRRPGARNEIREGNALPPSRRQLAHPGHHHRRDHRRTGQRRPELHEARDGGTLRDHALRDLHRRYLEHQLHHPPRQLRGRLLRRLLFPAISSPTSSRPTPTWNISTSAACTGIRAS